MTRNKFLALVLFFSFLLEPQMAYAGLIDSAKAKITTIVQGFLKDAGIDVDWQKLNLGFDSQGLRELQVSIKTKNLQVALPDAGVSANIKDVEIVVQMKIGLSGFQIISAKKAKLKGVVAEISPKNPPRDPKAPFLELPTISTFKLPSLLSKTKIEKVDIELQQLKIVSAEETIVVTAKAGSVKKDQIDLRTSLKGKDLTVTSLLSLKLHRQKGNINKLNADGSYNIASADTKINGFLNLSLAKKSTFTSNPTITLADGSVQKVSINGILTEAQTRSRVKIDINAALPQSVTSGMLSASFLCKSVMDWGPVPRQKVDISTNCQALVKPEKLSFKKQLPEFWKVDVAGKAKIARLDVINPQFYFKVAMNSPQTVGSAITSKLTSKTTLSGGLADNYSKWQVKPDADIRLDIKNFGFFVDGLKETPYAIPASLNELAGSVNLNANIKERNRKTKARGTISTSLKSLNQDVVLKVDVVAMLSHILDPKVIDVKAQMDLSKIKLQLPDILLESPPQLIGDKRFVTHEVLREDPPSKEALRWNYDITIKNPVSSPVLLLSNRTVDPIPLQIDINAIDHQPVKTKIEVGTFRLNLFKRQARIVNFYFLSRNDSEVGDVNGKVAIDYADYDIFVDVSGTVSHTILKMRSEPSLSESDIFAVLLFGEPMSSMDSGDASSAAHLQAAATSGAVALSSMYYLASTPVESINYNPATKSISAKMRIGKGTSMSIGREGSATSRLGIRRRLWGNWFTNSYVDRDDTSGQNKVATFLEWSYAY